MYKCKCELDKCLECPNVALNKKLCTKCNINYFPKENDPMNMGEYINCYKDPEGYYLGNNLYRKCYYTCKTCNISGNNISHNCIECNANYTIEIKYNNYFNCYNNCDDENNKYSTIDLTYLNKFPILEDSKMEYINSQTNISEDSDILTQFTILLSMTNSLSYLNEVTNNTKEYLNNNLNVISFANGDDFIVSSGKMNFIITTTKNQKKEINDNITTIDLGKCEMKLKDEYNISINESLYIVMIDILVENIQKLEYEVYYNFSSNNTTKLNLTVCKDIRIDISIPKDIPINEIDKYNKSSGFYNDICYTFTSNRGTDEILKDRRNDYKNNNISICEEDCDFTEYNANTKKAICSVL